jgi:hypothetical protein
VIDALADKLPKIAEHLEAPADVRGARSSRSIFTSEALIGRRVPERPARPCGLEPADAGGPAAGSAAEDGRWTPLEFVAKLLTAKLTSVDTTERNAGMLLHPRTARRALC